MKTHTHFHRRMQDIREDLLAMAGLVETAVNDAYNALLQRNPRLAKEVIDGDRRIDLMENEIDEKSIALLATQQPVAIDLRFLAATTKICSFLERVGDQSVNLSWRVITLAEMDPVEVPDVLKRIYEISHAMLHDSLDCFVNGDPDKARSIIERDDEVDRLTRRFLEDNIQSMNKEREVVRSGVEMILLSRHIERIADEATNVAEEVVYLVEGEVIRHQGHSDSDPSVGPL